MNDAFRIPVVTPLRTWRRQWPPVYEQLLVHLRRRHADQDAGQGERVAIRTFIQILMLQRSHPAAVVEQAIQAALAAGLAHVEGVTFCLHQRLDATPQVSPLDLSHQPHLAHIGRQPIVLERYNQLLGGGR